VDALVAIGNSGTSEIYNPKNGLSKIVERHTPLRQDLKIGLLLGDNIGGGEEISSIFSELT
jgi:hypothetical protein